jgi:hypothetical protein
MTTMTSIAKMSLMIAIPLSFAGWWIYDDITEPARIERQIEQCIEQAQDIPEADKQRATKHMECMYDAGFRLDPTKKGTKGCTDSYGAECFTSKAEPSKSKPKPEPEPFQPRRASRPAPDKERFARYHQCMMNNNSRQPYDYITHCMGAAGYKLNLRCTQTEMELCYEKMSDSWWSRWLEEDKQ